MQPLTKNSYMTEIVDIGPQYKTPRATTFQWKPAWLDSGPIATTQPQELPTLTADSTAVFEEPRLPLSDVDSDTTEFYFRNIYPRDAKHLLGPRSYPSPCPWCGGRLHHHELCRELRQSWEPVLSFGKHEGKSLSAVPVDYLQWLVKRSSIDVGLREAIESHLEVRKA